MTESRWRKALTEAMTNEYENCLCPAEEHVFSVKFERKMDRLAGVQKKPYYGAINSRIKRTAVIAISIAVLASALTISAGANSEKIADFFMRFSRDNTVFVPEEINEAPTIIEEVYEITYDMSDYYLDYDYSNYMGVSIGYANTDDENNIIQIDFSQLPKVHAEGHSISTDGNTVYETIDINGFEAVYFLNNHGFHHIVWDNGDYIFSIGSWHISKEETIAIAESVKKKPEEAVKEVYEITYDMSDYHLDYDLSCFMGIIIGYLNTDDEDNIKQIHFSQELKIYAENTDYSTDSSTVYEAIEVNGFEAVYFLDNHGTHYVVWENGDYILSIGCHNISKEETIAIAESVKKKEEK